MIAWLPCSAMMSVHRCLISASASSQVMRTNSPAPFGPTRRIGYSSRSAW